MMKNSLSPKMTVKELLDRHPRLLLTFMELGLLCAGCPTEAFHTLSDVAREYHLDRDVFLRRLGEDTNGDEA